MTNTIEKTGIALWGNRWQTDMAEALGVSDRTVRRWAGGDEPRPGVFVDLLRIVVERQAMLDDIAEVLKQKG